MKKLTILLGLFIVFSCEDDKDETPPTVMITNIQANVELSDVVKVIVDANDNDAIALVEFFANGVLNGTSESSEAIHTFNWDTDVGDNGSYQIYAKATDESDNVTSSSIITVNVINYRTANFVNTTVAPVAYRIDDMGDYTWISSGDTAKVQVPKKTTINFFGGTPTDYCGESLTWDFDVDVLDTDVFWSFWVGDSWFFLFTINNRWDIDYTTVNRDLTGQKTCYTTIPNNGVEYKLGFYRKHPDSNIYWYYDNHPDYGYRYVDGDTYKVNYKVPDASHTDRNYYARYTLQPFSEASDRIATDSYGDGYMGIPSRDENDTAQGGYGKIEK